MSLYTRDNSPFWYCEFEDEGKPVRKSTGVLISAKTPKAEERSKAKARQQEALVKQDYFKEKQQAAENAGAKPETTFEKFSEKFLEWSAIRHSSKPKTVAYYRERVAALLRFDTLKSAVLSRIDQEMIAGYIQFRSNSTKVYPIRGKNGKVTAGDSFQPISVATINRDLAVLKRVLNMAHEWKYRTQQPKIRKLSGEEGHERVVSHEEEKAYLDAAPALLRDFATIALDTGLQPDSELCALRWENVHLEPAGAAQFGYVHVVRGKTKNSKRNVPMAARVKAILDRRNQEAGKAQIGFVFEREDGTATPYCSIDTQHDRTLEKTKLRFRIYDFRHTFRTRLGESGADTYTIMKLMGHSSMLISQRYVHPTPERMETAFVHLDAYNAEKASAAAANAQGKKTPEKQTHRVVKTRTKAVEPPTLVPYN